MTLPTETPTKPPAAPLFGYAPSRPGPDAWLSMLALGLAAMGGGAVLIPGAIVGLLGLLGMPVAVATTGVALAKMRGPAPGAGGVLGTVVVVLGVFGLAVDLILTSAALSGAGGPAPTSGLLAGVVAGWLGLTALIALGVRMQGAPRRALASAAALVAATLPLTVAVGVVVWPHLPRSL